MNLKDLKNLFGKEEIVMAEENNLFDFATSELSQDAFICWLCNWVNIEVEKESDEEKLKNLAIKFIEEMSGEKLNERKVKIERQYVMSGEDEKGKSRKYIIDILLGIKNKENDGIVDKYIIIEDKTFTGVHGDQINKYREYLAKEKK